mgnify:CR=1 FL=1
MGKIADGNFHLTVSTSDNVGQDGLPDGATNSFMSTFYDDIYYDVPHGIIANDAPATQTVGTIDYDYRMVAVKSDADNYYKFYGYDADSTEDSAFYNFSGITYGTDYSDDDVQIDFPAISHNLVSGTETGFSLQGYSSKNLTFDANYSYALRKVLFGPLDFALGDYGYFETTGSSKVITAVKGFVDEEAGTVTLVVNFTYSGLGGTLTYVFSDIGDVDLTDSAFLADHADLALAISKAQTDVNG